MTVSSGPGGIGTRHINSNYPVEEGLELGTTKLSDDYILEPEEESLVTQELEGL